MDDSKANPTTLYIYRLAIDAHLRSAFGKLKACQLTTDHLRVYRRKRKADLIGRHIRLATQSVTPLSEPNHTEFAKSAGATVNRELSLLRSALKNGMKQTPRKVLQIPAFPMESEADNVRKVVLQDSDYPALRDSFDDPAVRLLFIVSSHTGIRASELKRIKWDQVDFAKGIIVLERGKTKNKDPRGAPIYGDMGPYLQEAKKQRDEFLR